MAENREKSSRGGRRVAARGGACLARRRRSWQRGGMAEFYMPTDAIMLARGMQAATGGVYRAVWLLAAVYWRSGCAPLPTDEVTQASVLRMSLSGWRQIKAAVLLTFSEIAPALAKEHARMVVVRDHRRANFQTAVGVRLAKVAVARQAKRSAVLPLSLPTQDHAPLHPPDMHVPAGISLPDTRRGQRRQAADAARNGRTFAD